MKRAIIVLFLLLIVSSSSFAQEKERKGFNIGLAIGIAPSVIWNDNHLDIKHSDYGHLSGGGIIGYNINNTDLFTFNTGNTLFDNDYYSGSKIELSITRVYLSWYHYLKESAPSLYSHLGIGIMNTDYRTDEDGMAYVLGVGYEVFKSVNLECELVLGKTKGNEFEYSNRILSLYIGYLFY